MKIAHVSATFPPYRGGTGNVCYHNARQLARLGHEVHVFTASAPLLESCHPDEGRIWGIAPKGHDKAGLRDGFTVHRLSPLVQVGNAPVLPQLVWNLRDFDLIHLHYPFILGAEMMRVASLMFDIPLAISFHNDLIGDGARAHLFAAGTLRCSSIQLHVASFLRWLVLIPRLLDESKSSRQALGWRRRASLSRRARRRL